MKKTNIKNLFLTFSLGILLPVTMVGAETQREIESHENIRGSVKQYLTEKSVEYQLNDINIQVGQLDHRLKLAKCSEPLNVQMRNDTMPGNMTVEVSCIKTQPWKIYIQASVHAYKPVYVAKSSILRGERIQPDSVKLMKRNITSLRGQYINDFTALEGTLAKRMINKGQIISPVHLIKSKLIKRGESVTIIAETAGITVRMKGKALNDAAAGEQVRVKNTNSKRIIEGIAIKRGQVKVNML